MQNINDIILNLQMMYAQYKIENSSDLEDVMII